MGIRWHWAYGDNHAERVQIGGARAIIGLDDIKNKYTLRTGSIFTRRRRDIFFFLYTYLHGHILKTDGRTRVFGTRTVLYIFTRCIQLHAYAVQPRSRRIP